MTKKMGLNTGCKPTCKVKMLLTHDLGGLNHRMGVFLPSRQPRSSKPKHAPKTDLKQQEFLMSRKFAGQHGASQFIWHPKSEILP